ncbi:hypothetical protein KCTC52924_03618 [Arenibacter antarcticus]|uniref:IrrE N-terminal-like domain-containing protein n=1 Tax=Arenibacter antarcticus TaxID=2040469 RepID=A0ABW5VF11_9FLAO|nr:hypothetical protein [Arenibacter sp. H213]MCM4168066.1 hypothetical protein [Arenibacter sp. H213]
MTWIIENKSHLDKGISEYVERIFSLTLSHISQRIGYQPPLGVKAIVLIYDCKQGPIVYWPLKQGKYEIGLCIEGIFPYQIIYQMAHEICHIYIDPRVNGTMIEIVCQKTALDILEEIGASLTNAGQAGVDKYISDIRLAAETNQNLTVEQLDPDSIFRRIQELESTKTLYDRDYNNLIAFKLKEIIDPIDKLGLIKSIRNSITPKPPSDTTDLNTNTQTQVNFDKLIENIKLDNLELAETLADIKKN